MGQYYWKDDTIHTNRQRAKEIGNVIQSSQYPSIINPIRFKRTSQVGDTQSSINNSKINY